MSFIYASLSSCSYSLSCWLPCAGLAIRLSLAVVSPGSRICFSLYSCCPLACPCFLLMCCCGFTPFLGESRCVITRTGRQNKTKRAVLRYGGAASGLPCKCSWGRARQGLPFAAEKERERDIYIYIYICSRRPSSPAPPRPPRYGSIQGCGAVRASVRSTSRAFASLVVCCAAVRFAHFAARDKLQRCRK